MLQLSNLLTSSKVAILPADTRDPLATLCRLATTSESQKARAALEVAVREREATASTLLGHDIAVPHAHIPQLRRFVLAIGVCPEPIPWPDERAAVTARIIVLIGAPEGRQSEYLRLLSRLVGVLRDADLREQLTRCVEVDEALRLLRAHIRPQ